MRKVTILKRLDFLIGEASAFHEKLVRFRMEMDLSTMTTTPKKERSGSRRHWTQKSHVLLLKLALEGRTADELAVEFDRSPGAIGARLREKLSPDAYDAWCRDAFRKEGE